MALYAWSDSTGTGPDTGYNKVMIVITGDNAFAVDRELKRLTDAYLEEHGGLGLERIDGETVDPARIREALTSIPFLAGAKLVVIRNLGANRQASEQVEQLFDDLPETTEVVLVEDKFDKRTAYYKFMKKHADFREFPALDRDGLASWLAKTAEQDGGTLSMADARYLVERVGMDQQLVANELEKLLTYDQKITRADIDLLTEATPQSTIFQLLEAAFAGNRRRALDLYAEQRALKVEPPQIIAMLAWQLHVLAIIKTAGGRTPDVIAGEARINPFVVRKSASIARDLTPSRLKTLINDLLNIDVRIKRTSTDPDEALQHYLLKLAK